MSVGRYHSQHVLRNQSMILYWFAFAIVGLRINFVAGVNIKKSILCHLKQTLRGSHLGFFNK